MGRAIVRQPQVFCMDEPLSNLDAKLRVSTRTQIAALQQRLGITTVYVTHDQVEAMTMGDRVAVMKDGRLQQVDTPLALYDRPANLFVAGFIGSPAMNLLAGNHRRRRRGRRRRRRDPDRPAAAAASTGKVTLGIRPEAWRVAERRRAGYPVKVAVVEELGADSYLYGTPQDAAPDLEGGVLRQIIARVRGSRRGSSAAQVVHLRGPARGRARLRHRDRRTPHRLSAAASRPISAARRVGAGEVARRPARRRRRSGAGSRRRTPRACRVRRASSSMSSSTSSIIAAKSPVFDSALSSGCRSAQPSTSSTGRYAGVEP